MATTQRRWEWTTNPLLNNFMCSTNYIGFARNLGVACLFYLRSKQPFIPHLHQLLKLQVTFLTAGHIFIGGICHGSTSSTANISESGLAGHNFSRWNCHGCASSTANMSKTGLVVTTCRGLSGMKTASPLARLIRLKALPTEHTHCNSSCVLSPEGDHRCTKDDQALSHFKTNSTFCGRTLLIATKSGLFVSSQTWLNSVPS